jgi:hypothetical protein
MSDNPNTFHLKIELTGGGLISAMPYGKRGCVGACDEKDPVMDEPLGSAIARARAYCKNAGGAAKLRIVGFVQKLDCGGASPVYPDRIRYPKKCYSSISSFPAMPTDPANYVEVPVADPDDGYFFFKGVTTACPTSPETRYCVVWAIWDNCNGAQLTMPLVYSFTLDCSDLPSCP